MTAHSSEYMKNQWSVHIKSQQRWWISWYVNYISIFKTSKGINSGGISQELKKVNKIVPVEFITCPLDLNIFLFKKIKIKNKPLCYWPSCSHAPLLWLSYSTTANIEILALKNCCNWKCSINYKVTQKQSSIYY